MNKGKYYMTTAIAYASGKPHIGNTYEAILADSKDYEDLLTIIKRFFCKEPRIFLVNVKIDCRLR